MSSSLRVCLECGRVLGSASLRINHQARSLHQSRILSSPSPSTSSASRSSFRFIDIAVNLTDPTFRGLDRKGKQLHESDFDHVIHRAKAQGVEKIIVSGTSLKASREAVALCKAHPESLEFERQEGVLESLLALAQDNRDVVVAIGEVGLDYTELKYCPKETQLRYFEAQFAMAETTQLPMFLHSREVGMDFVETVRRNRSRFKTGVVHSFTGNSEELKQLLDMGLSIGLSGCSLRTQDQLQLVSQIPLDRLMLETDAPWCDIQAIHAGFEFVKTSFPAAPKNKFQMGMCVQRRTEPAHVVQVCEVVAGCRGEDVASVAKATHHNTMQMFFNT